MKLIVINSNSSGNAYALDAGGEILLLEAGCKMADVKRAIDFRLNNVVGCAVTHEHGDHAKYAGEYARFGVNIYGPEALKTKKQFPFGRFVSIIAEKTYNIGSYRVVPFSNYHDVPIYGYLVNHKDMGTLLFSTDTYKIGMYLRNINHWLIEANYDDAILKANVQDGKIDRTQASRLMLSHMSLDNTIHYLHECEAEKSSTITLCHLSERNSDADLFCSKVKGNFGVPTFIARKGVVVELSKNII